MPRPRSPSRARGSRRARRVTQVGTLHRPWGFGARGSGQTEGVAGSVRSCDCKLAVDTVPPPTTCTLKTHKYQLLHLHRLTNGRTTTAGSATSSGDRAPVGTVVSDRLSRSARCCEMITRLNFAPRAAPRGRGFFTWAARRMTAMLLSPARPSPARRAFSRPLPAGLALKAA
jgi:hypothetical protein